jgi:hypothetical protein
MAKRKPTDMAQMNLRLPEKLRKMIEVEARKNGWSLNREMVRRLEQSMKNQAIENIVETTVLRLENSLLKQQRGLLDDLIEEFNRINRALGRDELVINLKQGEQSNG